MEAQVCTTLLYPRLVEFPSKSEPGVIHTVVAGTLFSDTICTCRGWQYRETCSHQREVDDTRCNYIDPFGVAETCPHCNEPVEVYEFDPEWN
jgi:hypothetical protein